MRYATRRRRRRSLLAVALAVAVGALTGAARPHDGFDRRSGHLEGALLEALRAEHFDQVVDFGPVEGACPGSSWCPSRAPTIAHMPNIDLAVIALPSWHPKADVSTVVPRLTGPVTSFQHSFWVTNRWIPAAAISPGRLPA